MSRLTGGIFSEVSGTTAGVTFGKARTREGKVTTGRQYTIPSNPNTAGQQTQRSKFSNAKNIVRACTSGWYQDAFNRAVSQLPGFQSMMSIVLNALGSTSTLSAPSQTNLGSLDSPQSIVITAANTDASIVVDYAATIPLKGNAADKIYAVAIPATAAKRASLGNAYPRLGIETRSDTSLSIETPALVTGDHWIVGVFAKGQTTNVGVFSPCTWFDVTVTA